MRPLKPLTASDIDSLLADREKLSSLTGRFVVKWGGGDLPGGIYQMPWPEYPKVVERFFEMTGDDPWLDYNYVPAVVGAMVRDRAPFTDASLDEVRTMLTWCTRGERFCDGHWEAVLEDGTVFRLLDRLAEIRKEMGEG